MESDTDARYLKNISIGIEVKIEIPGINKILSGEVLDFVNDQISHNPNGIEVIITGNYSGNVKKIIKNDELISENQLRIKIKNHEQKTFELKSSFSYDVDVSRHTGNPTSAEYLKRKIIEECASFMNSDGGIVCIGVDDDKNILGLQNDYELQSDYDPQKDVSEIQDTLRNEIKQNLINYLDDPIIFNLYEIKIIHLDGKDVCCIFVDKSPVPIFVKIKINYRLDGKDKVDTIWKCWIRADNGIRNIPFDTFIQIWDQRD